MWDIYLYGIEVGMTPQFETVNLMTGRTVLLTGKNERVSWWVTEYDGSIPLEWENHTAGWKMTMKQGRWLYYDDINCVHGLLNDDDIVRFVEWKELRMMETAKLMARQWKLRRGSMSVIIIVMYTTPLLVCWS